jgi:hypothetical protein
MRAKLHIQAHNRMISEQFIRAGGRSVLSCGGDTTVKLTASARRGEDSRGGAWRFDF